MKLIQSCPRGAHFVSPEAPPRGLIYSARWCGGAGAIYAMAHLSPLLHGLFKTSSANTRVLHGFPRFSGNTAPAAGFVLDYLCIPARFFHIAWNCSNLVRAVFTPALRGLRRAARFIPGGGAAGRALSMQWHIYSRFCMDYSRHLRRTRAYCMDFLAFQAIPRRQPDSSWIIYASRRGSSILHGTDPILSARCSLWLSGGSAARPDLFGAARSYFLHR